ncbi:MAG: class I tRNA ligase family protein, partial [Nanoarchaeota archaeon]
MVKNTFYITTPIYYPNDIPHIGHAYTTLAADILARWQSLQKKKVFFLTGTDEHGKKIENAAKEKGKNPKEFVDELVPHFKNAWKKLNIHYTRFIRTTEADHADVVKDVLAIIYKNKDIYLGEYEGYYCTGCEAYYTEKEALDLICPIHKKNLEKLDKEIRRRINN